MTNLSSSKLELRLSRSAAGCDKSARRAARSSAYFHGKRHWVRLVAVLLLVITAPVILLSMLLVRITSRGAAIYRQVRVGRKSQNFTIYKIRTMRDDAESLTGPVWSTRGDARITPLGRFLRRSHIDELPQLVNIIRGEMCLFGPRPERPEIVEDLKQAIPDYLDRVEVLPGVTGLAQIKLPADVDIAGVRLKQQADLAYIQNARLILDLKILTCTLLQLFGMTRDASLWLCRVDPTIPDVETLPAIMPGDAMVDDDEEVRRAA